MVARIKDLKEIEKKLREKNNGWLNLNEFTRELEKEGLCCCYKCIDRVMKNEEVVRKMDKEKEFICGSKVNVELNGFLFSGVVDGILEDGILVTLDTQRIIVDISRIKEY